MSAPPVKTLCTQKSARSRPLNGSSRMTRPIGLETSPTRLSDWARTSDRLARSQVDMEMRPGRSRLSLVFPERASNTRTELNFELLMALEAETESHWPSGDQSSPYR